MGAGELCLRTCLPTVGASSSVATKWECTPADVEQSGVLQGGSKQALVDVPQKSSEMGGYLWNEELAFVMLPQPLVEKKRETLGHWASGKGRMCAACITS